MSVPAIVWIDSIHVGSSTAKALLRYLATHNFHKPGFFFKNSTYAKALEISERSLQRAFEHLEKNKFITIERRFDENGRQIANGLYLNIPDDFLNKYERIIEGVGDSPPPTDKNDTLGVGDKVSSLGVTQCRGGGRHNDAPYNSKRSNNKINSKRESTLTQNFEPDEKRKAKLSETATRSGLAKDDLLTKFKNIYQINQKRSTDWQLEFENFLINEKSKPEPSQYKPVNQEARCTVPDYGPGHPTWDAMNDWENKNRSKQLASQ